MKKMIFFAAIAALALGSCTKTEITGKTEQNAVSFGSYVGSTPVSKATVGDIDLAKLQASEDGFGVYCYYTAKDNYKAGESKPNFMLNQKVTYSSGAWTYSPLKYWPNNDGDKLTFRAYAPYSDGSANCISNLPGEDDARTTLTYTIDTTNPVDLLYAGSEGLSNCTKPSVTGTTNFAFKHALSKISFTYQASVDAVTPGSNDVDANTTINLTAVKVVGSALSESGTFNFATGEWSGLTASTDATLIDTTLAGATKVTSEKAALLRLLGDGSSKANKSCLVFPSASQDLKVTIKYDVITKDSNYASGEVKVPNEITKEISAPLEAGKHYVLNLQIGLTSVKVNVTSVVGWDDATTIIAVDLPKNNE